MLTSHSSSSAARRSARHAGCQQHPVKTRQLPWFVQTGVALGVLLFSFCGALVVSGWTGSSSSEEGGRSELPAQRVLAGPHVVQAAVQLDGKDIYQTRCQSCHQMQGQGIPGVFPPLVDSEWVTGDKGRLIRLLLQGMMGAVDVKGTTYSGAMPPWGGSLDDEQIAQVSTYIRTSWGNDAAAVTADEVARVRAATEGRKNPWTAEELNAEANQGIPDASAGG